MSWHITFKLQNIKDKEKSERNQRETQLIYSGKKYKN